MKKILYLLLLLFFHYTLNAQDKVALSGYISNLQSQMFTDVHGDWLNDNLVHNRLNFFAYPTNNLEFSVQVRNRLFTGETMKYTPDYAQSLKKDNGWMQLSVNSISEKSIILNNTIDRLYLKYTKGKFDITLGRQRINWGQSFVWNPNDVFNAYSFFDFDYAEKPGADALRIQYYATPSSSIELATKINHDKKKTIALRGIANLAGYDWQLVGGILDEKDYMAGLGWTGAIKSISFTGEMSYIRSKENFKDTTGLFLADIGFNYSFGNSLMLQAEFLYADLKSEITNFQSFYYQDLNLKNLAFTKYNIFTQMSYPITPLLNMSISGMLYPKIKGWFAGPNISYSLSDNAEFSVFVQAFSGEFPDMTGETKRQDFYFGFLRLKYHF